MCYGDEHDEHDEHVRVLWKMVIKWLLIFMISVYENNNLFKLFSWSKSTH